MKRLTIILSIIVLFSISILLPTPTATKVVYTTVYSCEMVTTGPMVAGEYTTQTDSWQLFGRDTAITDTTNNNTRRLLW